jgi:hypothetical protein
MEYRDQPESQGGRESGLDARAQIGSTRPEAELYSGPSWESHG